MLTEHASPRAHLVMDDFFAPADLGAVFREIRALDRRMKPGLVRDIGHDGQSVFFEHARRRNRAIWIHDPSPTLRLFREQLWSEPMVDAFERAREPLFQIIPNCWAPHLQVSSYMTGDRYDFHVDEGAGVNLTAIVFLAAHPSKVRGGDLVLSYGGEETKIRFRHNRLVLFPSKTLHRVTPVRVASTDAADARVSLQCWLTYGRPPAKPKRRPPEADLPTFFLAEESLLAVAQGLLDPAARDPSPEDLYWGAFYVTRILASNLRCLVADASELALGKIKIRRGRDLEVYARGRHAGLAVRVGFRLAGPAVPPACALSLFVEAGVGDAQSAPASRVVPPEAGERETRALLRRLLAGARRGLRRSKS